MWWVLAMNIVRTMGASFLPTCAGLVLCLALALPAAAAETPPADVTAEWLIDRMVNQNRGESSYAELSMIVHRPAWERTSSLKTWTRGRKDVLMRFTAPARDLGNATLRLDDKMWTFTPNLNRTIRLPYSLMSQSWGGSDFSYSDLARSDDWQQDYDLAITAVGEHDGHAVYTITAIPHDDAPVVWGKEVIELRDDYVVLAHTFYDQELTALKQLKTLAIGDVGGRTMAMRVRMTKMEEPESYTEVIWDKAEFDIKPDDSMFTLFYLKSGS
jgi:hypothetical protein